MRRPFSFPLTREGLLWFLVSGAMLVTALLKGINLVLLLACWMVGVIFLNYFWARRQLRKVAIRRFLGEPAFAGTPCPVHLRLENTSRRRVFGLAIREENVSSKRAGFVAQLNAGQLEALHYRVVFPRRGRQVWQGLRFTCGYPLGLVCLQHFPGTDDELIVFPRLGILQRGLLRRFLTRHSPSLGQAQVFPRRQPGAQSEFHGLRAFRAGDSPRWIHWRTTARRGELMVREFEDLPNDQLVLIVETGFPVGFAENGSAHSAGRLLERALSFAATVCWEWCRQKGDRFVLAITGPAPIVIPGVTGMPLALAMLEALALAAAHETADHTKFIDSLSAVTLPAGPVLLVTTHDSELEGALSGQLCRSIATINIARQDDADFFELKAPIGEPITS